MNKFNFTNREVNVEKQSKICETKRHKLVVIKLARVVYIVEVTRSQ